MLDASLAHMEDQIRRAYDWPVRFEAVDVEQDGRTSWLLEFRLQQLLASEGFDAVVIEELSRISRDPEGIRRFVETCTSAGVRVLCTAERFDTANMCDS